MVVRGSDEAGEVESGVEVLDDDLRFCMDMDAGAVVVCGEVVESANEELEVTVGTGRASGSFSPVKATSSAGDGLYGSPSGRRLTGGNAASPSAD